MKKIVIVTLVWTFTTVGGFLFWNDMRFQRDTALITAEWCRDKPTSNRCQDNFGVNHWYFYGLTSK